MSTDTNDTDRDEPHIQKGLRALDDYFQTEHDLGEMALQGLIGYHTFFNHEDALDDPAVGMETMIHMAFERTTQELWVDSDLVEQEHGEVTPETIAEEARMQLEDLCGMGGVGGRFAERFEENLRDVIEQRQDALDREYRQTGLDDHDPR